ncbi:Zinc-containing alcohol dehydrogenase superfamily [Cupriavidus taiwanensis]|uniref:Zinc-containing alcohol dehydrogenase superfamily n=1 Tax=Cupriavidus taiwanensis TaxID=164546 RepID=A0A375CRC0_9BURK|nr:NAD(P)-dependent alcohol dehydrogenase [Cupriavidus taiwanensis]SOY77956.1 Zinc-containing alcohol dehydrogenase superfamily [Cupriavidus taiwanensis]
MTASKAIYLEPPGGLDRLTLGETEAKVPDPGEITVRIHASSLNYHDFGVVSRGTGVLRRIPMSDGAGVVMATGAGVDEFSVGDRVVSTFFPTWIDGEPDLSDFATVPGDGIDGFAREMVTMPATAFTHAPAGYSHAEAATLTTAGLTAWRALFVDGAVKPGETVLVLGTGGVSIFALQFAKTAGATVIATSGSDDKLARLRSLGADHVINYRNDPQWGSTVRALTGGAGADHVIEVGGAATLEQSITAVRTGGRVAVIGVLSGADTPFNVRQILRKQLRITGLLVGSRRHQLDMVRALNGTGMRPVIDRHFPLHEIAEAFRYQASGQHIGKIVLDI